MLLISTGLRNSLLGSNSLAETMGDMICNIYTGTAPTLADDAVTGQLLVSITNNSKTTAQKQKLTVTASLVNSFTYTLTINGVTINFSSSSSATLDEISSGLVNAINTAVGNTSSFQIVNPKIFNKVVATDISNNSGQFTIEAVEAGNLFFYSFGDNLSYTIDVEDAYYIHFERGNNVADGTLEKKADEVWSGVCSASGTAGYFRLVRKDDDGTESFTAPRIQGTVSTVGGDMNVTSVNFVKNATQTVDLANIILPNG